MEVRAGFRVTLLLRLSSHKLWATAAAAYLPAASKESGTRRR